jgi:nitrate/TMAO reductase-like tetraheme cytochrome c subunit
MGRWLSWLTQPSKTIALGVLVGIGLLAGAGGLLAFDFTMAATSTDEFCLSCHELQENIGYEYETMSHARNRLGIRATCSNCHLPKPFVPKMQRKLRAVAEIYHHLLGTIDTPEKFEHHRMRMATRVWADMNDNDSRECRSCHDSGSWDTTKQKAEVREFHEGPIVNGKTCIDCHKGVAHSLPKDVVPDAQLEGIDF